MLGVDRIELSVRLPETPTNCSEKSTEGALADDGMEVLGDGDGRMDGFDDVVVSAGVFRGGDPDGALDGDLVGMPLLGADDAAVTEGLDGFMLGVVVLGVAVFGCEVLGCAVLGCVVLCCEVLGAPLFAGVMVGDVGARLGPLDGDKLGPIEGGALGFLVGDWDGLPDGVVDGVPDGDRLGFMLGPNDGKLEGLDDGCVELGGVLGRAVVGSVGARLGVPDGVLLGVNVGGGTGAPDGGIIGGRVGFAVQAGTPGYPIHILINVDSYVPMNESIFRPKVDSK